MLFGSGALERVCAETKRLETKDALVVSDKTLVNLGIPDKVRRSLENVRLKVDIFDQVEAESTLETAEHAAMYARRGKYHLVVGLRGNVLDMPKASSIAIINHSDLA